MAIYRGTKVIYLITTWHSSTNRQCSNTFLTLSPLLAPVWCPLLFLSLWSSLILVFGPVLSDACLLFLVCSLPPTFLPFFAAFLEKCFAALEAALAVMLNQASAAGISKPEFWDTVPWLLLHVPVHTEFTKCPASNNTQNQDHNSKLTAKVHDLRSKLTTKEVPNQWKRQVSVSILAILFIGPICICVPILTNTRL